MSEEVVVLVIENRYGRDLYAFRTYVAAEAYAVRYALERWNIRDLGMVPMTDGTHDADEILDAFFGCETDDWYYIEELEIAE